MKLTDKIAARDPSRPFYFFEFFPPRTDQGFQNLLTRISRLAKLYPLAISITWGAGGSTKDRSLDLASITQSEHGIDTILHLTCTNMMQGMVDLALKSAKDRGIQNLLALRGDPPRGQEEWIPIDPRFKHGIDLVSYIRASQFSSDFCIGVAGYPDGHPENTKSEDEEIQFLKEKVDAGADFIITQLFYDVDQYIHWVKKVRAKGITVPIIPGVMPIQTYASFQRLTKLCGVKVPPKVLVDLDPIKSDDQLVKEYGIKLAVEMMSRLVGEGHSSGAHFCTLNLEKSVQKVLESLNWAGSALQPKQLRNKLIADKDEVPPTPTTTEDSRLMITPSSATSSAQIGLANIPSAQTEVGSGELNNYASWDDFPNGRFGDFKSPAYGEHDPWGNQQIAVRGGASPEWGHPNTLEDLTRIFMDHLHGKISTTPFSPTPLSPESMMILPHLENLTKRGWWTVCSQPAVDGVSSADDVVGWGPRAGYVFQKGFVEFFCTEEDVLMLQDRVALKGLGMVHWFAGNSENDFKTNIPEDGRNAVTWGVFPGQEIIQTTIIERESFLSWKDEVFSVWSQWASYYPPHSAERSILENVKKERWLVSVVHHNYKDTQALWTFLLQE